uniref:Dehydrogenase/reductase 11 n=1 Tax=Anas platyrhynchos TaxID=8839 RepID=A0A8B9ZK94_ANAPL
AGRRGRRWAGRVALVTGASVGIGAAVARALVQHGMKVVGCARSVDKIEKLAAECQSAGYPGTLIPYKFDVCINNAGLARPEPLLSGEDGGLVNVMAVSICTREAYHMNGHSVVPQSVVHFYSATKYAVTALTEGLRQELREAKTHIRATCISPGLVETGFAFKLHDNDPERAAATYESIRCLKAEDMANAVIYVLSAPPHVQVSLWLCWRTAVGS